MTRPPLVLAGVGTGGGSCMDSPIFMLPAWHFLVFESVTPEGGSRAICKNAQGHSGRTRGDAFQATSTFQDSLGNTAKGI